MYRDATDLAAILSPTDEFFRRGPRFMAVGLNFKTLS